jgi:hypothetical protein
MRTSGATVARARVALVVSSAIVLATGCLLAIPFDSLDDAPADANSSSDASSPDLDSGDPCDTPCPMGTCRADLGGGSAACVIATGLRKPRLGLSVDTKNAYWTTLCGELQKRSLTGGDTETLFTRDGAIFGGLATDAVSATWADKKNHVVMLMPLTGAPALTTIVPANDAAFSDPVDVSIGAKTGSIYWLGGYDLWSVARDGGVPTSDPLEVIRSTGPASALVVHEPHLGWALAGRDGLDAGGGIRALDLDAGEDAATTVFDGPSPVRGIADDGSRYFWTSDDGTISTAAYGGGPVRVIARGEVNPTGIAVDESWVYWTARGTGNDGAVRRAQKTGDADAGNLLQTYVTGRAFPGAILVTSAFVYWVDEGADDPVSCTDPNVSMGSVERVNK